MSIKKQDVIAKYKKLVPQKVKGVNVKKMNKTELIHKLQVAEGHTPCYKGSFAKQCGQTDCLWYKECTK